MCPRIVQRRHKREPRFQGCPPESAAIMALTARPPINMRGQGLEIVHRLPDGVRMRDEVAQGRFATKLTLFEREPLVTERVFNRIRNCGS
jgi:hypothetical protein